MFAAAADDLFLGRPGLRALFSDMGLDQRASTFVKSRAKIGIKLAGIIGQSESRVSAVKDDPVTNFSFSALTLSSLPI